LAGGANIDGMDQDHHNGPSPERRRGRPKGAKDHVKRRPRHNPESVLNVKVSGVGLTEFAAAGRDIDLVGMLRIAQASIVKMIIEERDSPDIERRASLRDAAVALNRMEMERLRADPQSLSPPARAVPKQPGVEPFRLSDILNRVPGQA
jgi:hypothetical protein